MMNLVAVVTILTLTMLPAIASRGEVIPDTNRVTFAVHCYDVGASTLDNLPGVLQIERGWQGRQEVNRIVFDPRQISVEQMAEHLRRAGTYLGTLNATGHPEPGQDSPR